MLSPNSNGLFKVAGPKRSEGSGVVRVSSRKSSTLTLSSPENRQTGSPTSVPESLRGVLETMLRKTSNEHISAGFTFSLSDRHKRQKTFVSDDLESVYWIFAVLGEFRLESHLDILEKGLAGETDARLVGFASLCVDLLEFYQSEDSQPFEKRVELLASYCLNRLKPDEISEKTLALVSDLLHAIDDLIHRNAHKLGIQSTLSMTEKGNSKGGRGARVEVISF